MTPDPKQEGQRWQAAARNDLQGAKLLRQGQLHNLACFHCHQAAEKALKAILYAHGAQRVMGHGVQDLVKSVGKVDPASATIAPEAAKLDRHYIPTRYPNGLPGGTPSEAYDSTDSEHAESVAEQVLQLAEQAIRSLPSG
jgi:HEPN domain-containing protein